MSSERGGKFLASGAVPEGARKFPEEPLDTEGRCAKLRRTRKLPAAGDPNGSWPCRGLERLYGASARGPAEPGVWTSGSVILDYQELALLALLALASLHVLSTLLGASGLLFLLMLLALAE